MIPGILITDGGPHSPEDYATMTASKLMEAFQVKPESPSATRIEIAKKRAEVAITDIMLKHHKIVQDLERQHMLDGHHDRLIDFTFDPEEHADIDQAVCDVRAAVQPVLDLCTNKALLPGETNMGQGIEHLSVEQHLVTIIRQRIEADLRSVIHIERSWEVDRLIENDPEHKHAIAFKAFHTRSGHPSDWHPLINPSNPDALPIKH
jgi:hypothetical protein